MKTKQQIEKQLEITFDECWRIRHELHMQDGTYQKDLVKTENSCILQGIKVAKELDQRYPDLADFLRTAEPYVIILRGQEALGELQTLRWVLDNYAEWEKSGLADT